MLHHLYGILERPPLTSQLPPVGVEERSVLVRRVGRFVVLSTLFDTPPRPTPSALSRHHDVIAAASAPGPLFPLPFGVAVPLGGLETWLALRDAVLRAGLRQARGRVEMHVRVLALRFGAGDPARLCTVADRVAEATGETNWRSRISGRADNATITLAFLVPRAGVAAFLTRIAPIAARAGDVAVVPSGPWPPLTFMPGLEVEAPADPAPVRYAV